MKTILPKLALLGAGALLASTAFAQSTTPCPQLPADAPLHWEARNTSQTAFCRALREDGSEAFGLYIAAKPGFEPSRRNREEDGTIDGRAVIWYRTEIATVPGIRARETLLPFSDGRAAHFWLQAGSQQDLADTLQLVSHLRFGTEPSQARPSQSPQVAGN